MEYRESDPNIGSRVTRLEVHVEHLLRKVTEFRTEIYRLEDKIFAADLKRTEEAVTRAGQASRP